MLNLMAFSSKILMNTPSVKCYKRNTSKEKQFKTEATKITQRLLQTTLPERAQKAYGYTTVSKARCCETFLGMSVKRRGKCNLGKKKKEKISQEVQKTTVD